MAFDGIILDVDGTLWDSTPVVAAAWNRVAQSYGADVRVDAERLSGLFGKTMDEIARELMPDLDDDTRNDIMNRSIEAENEDLLKTLSGEKGSDDISDIVDKLTVYPVLKFSLRGRLF